MSFLSAALLARGDARLLRIPPYLSLLCIVIGVAWLLLLPIDDYSRGTYISENALLPGQVHTYFAGSDQNVFRALKHEVNAMAEQSNEEINNKLEELLRSTDLKVARQRFNYRSSGMNYTGENIYAILHAPRGDATEAIVLVGAWKNMEGLLNNSGVALVLTLARYFKRWSLWSKDIIFLITPDSRAGPQAWVDAYHDTHLSKDIASLPLKSGALQGAVAIDYPFDHRFESIHIVYDGVNGQLPNLDLLNTVENIAKGQMGIGVSIQEMWSHEDSYNDRLRTMLRGMLRQGLGRAVGPHSCFIPYHVDAITLQPYGEGWQDEMAMGRVIESTFRSLNNLLEHLHQSFFFYLLMHSKRFVSIGTYLPSAMLVAVNFTITAIFLWIQSGRPSSSTNKANSKLVVLDQGDAKALVPEALLAVQERELFLPFLLIAGTQATSVIPLYLFNHGSQTTMSTYFTYFWGVNVFLPMAASEFIHHFAKPSLQQYQLLQSFSLLLLGMFLSSLATLNFSLALIVGLLSTPLSFIRPLPARPLVVTFLTGAMCLVTPSQIALAASIYWDIPKLQILEEAAFGWNVCGMTTQVVIWCVWWPAWLVGAVVLRGKPRDQVCQDLFSSKSA